MATLSQSTATIDGARNLAVVDIEQGERFVLPVRFKTAGQNDDISSWVFSLTAETTLAYVETDAAGNTTVRDAVPVEPMNPVVLPKVEVSSLEPSTVDIVIPPDLFTDEIMFDPLRAPVVVLYFRVQKGSAVDEPPVDIHRIPVVIRRGQKLDAPQSSTGPTVVVTGTQIRDQLQMLSGEERLDASAVKNLPTEGVSGLNQSQVDARIALEARAGNTDRWGTAKVPTLASLGGITRNDAQSVADNAALQRYTPTEKSKLAGIETGATADQTPQEIRNSLQGLTGAARLSASAVKDLPTEGTSGLTEGQVDARVKVGVQDWAESENTDAIPSAKLANQRFTSSDKSKLDGISSGAEVNVNADWDATTGDALIENKPTLVTAFTGLSDTPSALTGQGGKHVAVNSGASALEFVDAPTGGGSASPTFPISSAATRVAGWTNPFGQRTHLAAITSDFRNALINLPRSMFGAMKFQGTAPTFPIGARLTLVNNTTTNTQEVQIIFTATGTRQPWSLASGLTWHIRVETRNAANTGVQYTNVLELVFPAASPTNTLVITGIPVDTDAFIASWNQINSNMSRNHDITIYQAARFTPGATTKLAGIAAGAEVNVQPELEPDHHNCRRLHKEQAFHRRRGIDSKPSGCQSSRGNIGGSKSRKYRQVGESQGSFRYRVHRYPEVHDCRRNETRWDSRRCRSQRAERLERIVGRRADTQQTHDTGSPGSFQLGRQYGRCEDSQQAHFGDGFHWTFRYARFLLRTKREIRCRQFGCHGA